MTLYRIDLAYIGTDFHGWQSQSSGRGVQDAIERALETILRHPLRITGASRTDSGVHAEHQVATFESDAPFDELRWMYSLKGILPRSIGIYKITPQDAPFHPIRAAQKKTYRYRLWTKPFTNPFLRSFVWELPASLNCNLVRSELENIVGTHDFTAFCAVDSSAKTRVRTILSVETTEQNGLIDITMTGEGFLKQMVRSLVGTAAYVGLGKMPPGAILKALQSKSRLDAGKTAPAQGLCLMEIVYGKKPSDQVQLEE